MSMFCKHKWLLLSETITKSGIEVLNDAGCASIKGVQDSLTARKFIQIVTCDKCGQLKRFVEKI